jgi:hypothetical protein
VLQICSRYGCTSGNRPFSKINLRSTNDQLQQSFAQVRTQIGRHLRKRHRPISPSGRQDLNLRPLDPQAGPQSSVTCGNRESAGHGGPVQLRWTLFSVVQRISVLQICSTPLGQRADGSHRTFGRAAPLSPPPHCPTTKIHDVRRGNRLGCLIEEHQQIASVGTHSLHRGCPPAAVAPTTTAPSPAARPTPKRCAAYDDGCPTTSDER